MNRRTLIRQLGLVFPALSLNIPPDGLRYLEDIADGEKILKGRFKPTWESLQTYQVPAWYQNAKFGIWAHWGPQCEPEAGDWYARGMYEEGSNQYNYHVKKYGHPSSFGFKDVINEWKADQWNPEELVALYKSAGARYFIAMGNHHDNFDMFNSKYQKNWNSTKIGPKKDIIAGWASAARNQDLHFGVSLHAAHAWRWFEDAQRSDKNGPLAGVPYDGNITKADGKGKWWEGLDPQELYAQRHPLSENSLDNNAIHGQWHWGNGVYPPSKAYIEKFVNRTLDLIKKYQPDLLYFDDSQLPFWPINDAGLRIAAHHYNNSIKKHGELRAVINGKILNEDQRKAMVWDIERGQANDIQPFVWQTDTCIGDWHYNRSLYERKGYKTAQMVIQTMVDVVSKNGNYLLNIPVRGNGTIDELERKVVEDVGRWMKLNSESIYDTRPWIKFGEGPSVENQAKLTAQGFNEGKTKFTSQDVRFNTKGAILFATIMAWPENNKAIIKSLRTGNPDFIKPIQKVEWLGGKQSLEFTQTSDGLEVTFPGILEEDNYAPVIKIV